MTVFKFSRATNVSNTNDRLLNFICKRNETRRDEMRLDEIWATKIKNGVTFGKSVRGIQSQFGQYLNIQLDFGRAIFLSGKLKMASQNGTYSIFYLCILYIFQI